MTSPIWKGQWAMTCTRGDACFSVRYYVHDVGDLNFISGGSSGQKWSSLKLLNRLYCEDNDMTFSSRRVRR